MRKGSIKSLFLVAFAIISISTTTVMGYVVWDPWGGDSPPPPPTSTLSIDSRPYDEFIIDDGNSITLKWKATTDKPTRGYTITIGSATYTGSWTSGTDISFNFDPSDSGYAIGSITIHISIKDSVKSRTDSLVVIISGHSDGDSLNDAIEQFYTGTDITSYYNFFTGPTVDVRLHFRAGKAKVDFGGRIDSNGYGTIPRRLYHNLQKYVCTTNSNIVRIERTDPIKILHIDDWSWAPLSLLYITHGFAVKTCIMNEIRYEYKEGTHYTWEKYNIAESTKSSYEGYEKAIQDGYDVICHAMGGTYTGYGTKLSTLVEELGTVIVVGTGNDMGALSEKSKHPLTIAPGAATEIDYNTISSLPNFYRVGIYSRTLFSNFGEGMDFLVDGNLAGVPLQWTSWATGKCTGMVTNMLCANQNLDPVTLRNLMRKSCIKNLFSQLDYGPYPYGSVDDWPDYGWYEYHGYGLLLPNYCHDLATEQLDEPY